MDSTPEFSRHSVDHQSFASVTMGSPATSVFSKGHMSKSSASSLSIASSPTTRESLDFFGPRLGKVAEEQERDGPGRTSNIAYSPTSSNDYDLYFGTEAQPSPTSFALSTEHTIGKHTDFSAMSLDNLHAKRQRSGDYSTSTLPRRLSSRFGSMSRRFKNRSDGGLPLSIVTHMSAPSSRAGSTSSAQLVSPAVSAISKHESYLPPSPAQEAATDSVHGAFADYDFDQEMEDEPLEQAQATTPLLPPTFVSHLYEEMPLQSPLQSPSIAPTPGVLSSATSPRAGPLPGATLPSPPLSTKQSLASIRQRSQANATVAPIAEIPPLQLSGQDQWSHSLGHANFSIHPEPYLPEVLNVDTFAEFNANWDVARRNYSKHLDRTIEHHGAKSKVFKLTVEKWTSIDSVWKAYHDELQRSISDQIAELKRLSDQSQTSQRQVLPSSRTAMPEIDWKSGKFPQLGDGEIAFPMEVAPPRSTIMSPDRSPTSPRKRSLFRFLHDMLAKA